MKITGSPCKPGQFDLARTRIASLIVNFLVALTAATTVAHAASEQLLFAYFDGSQTNGMYLAIRNDQGVWQRLNGGQPVFKAAVGEWNIFRDPHLSREHDGRWRIVWTAGSNSYGFADSADLVTFSAARAIPTSNGVAGGFKYTWAPEINWDASTASYLITWSSTLATSPLDWMNDGDHRIYAHNTKDFIDFTPSRKFYDPGYTCIDSNLIQQGGQWRLFFKDERSGYKAMRMASSDSINGPWSAPSALITPGWSEGPTVIPEAGGYSLYFDYFTRGGAYGVVTSSDLKTWSAPQDVPTRFEVRHGSFVWLSATDADRLRTRYGGEPVPVQSPFNGTPMAIPGTIAVAKYDNGGEGVAYHDLDAVNYASGTYRPGDTVDSSGSGVGWILAGEWLEYTVQVNAAGSYNLAIWVSHPGNGGAMHVSINGGSVTGTLNLPNTGSWSTFQPINTTVNLSAGTHVMQVAFDANGSTGYGPGLGDIVISNSAPVTQSPFSGVPMTIPGTIATSKYDNGGEGVAYHDTDAVNDFTSTYRAGLGVDADGTSIGWIQGGEWLEYTVNVGSSATYTVAIPVANPGNGGSFHINFNGVNKTGSISVPNTGNWGTYQTLLVSASLSTGNNQIMQIVFDANSSAGAVTNLKNIDFFAGGGMPVPGTIQVAQYDNGGEGVAYHDVDAANLMSSTYRPGQGVDSNGSGVGWISAGEWIKYTVNVSTAGTYTMAIPVSHPGTGGAMHVTCNGVNVTGALGLPNTGGWEIYQSITKTVMLSAGVQVLQVFFDTNGSTGYGPGLRDIVINNTPTGSG